METKSPLQALAMNRSWVLFQKSGPEIKRAWGALAGTGTLEIAEGAEAAALKAKVEADKGSVRELPPAYLAIPTGFDLQVHLRYPGQADRETLNGGLASAFAGGFDSIVTMPNTNPFLDDPALLEKAISEVDAEIARQKMPLSVYFTAAGTCGMKGDKEADILGLAKAGAVAITDDGWGVRSPSAMENIFRLVAEAGIPFLQHAETPGHHGHASESAFQKKFAIAPYPRTAESSMVARDIELLRKVPKARYHVLHVSTRETLAEIQKGKEAGLNITCEVSPHHLYFSNADIPEANAQLTNSFKMNPPLFSPEDRAALVDALASGLIDCVSTDHAPHSAEAKANAWETAPFGTRGMETELPVLLTLLWQGKLNQKRLHEVWTHAARRILGVGKVGMPMGLVFVDPSREYIVDEKELPGISKNSCFLGAKLRGRIDFRGDAAALFGRDGLNI